MAAPSVKLTSPPTNTLEQCDASLGAYLRAWDQVEHQLLPLLNALLGTHQSATLAILRSGLNQPTLRTILDALGSIRLKEGDQKKLNALLSRWKTASTKRNKLVHGHWMLSIEMVPGPSGKRDHTKSEWVRFYSPNNSADYENIFGSKRDEKLRAAHLFKLSDINRAAAHVRKLAADIEAFNATIAVMPFVTPGHIEIEQ